MMRHVRIEREFDSFRRKARELVALGVRPEEITWDDGSGQTFLFGAAPSAESARSPEHGAPPAKNVPRGFVEKASLAALHRDGSRWALLYRVLFRLTHGEPELLEVTTDPDVARLTNLVHAVKRDEHRMHAFLRFRRVAPEGPDAPESFVAWYEPDYDIVALAAPHFARRYRNMRWVILTPERTAVWSGSELRIEGGAARDAAPGGDELEELFRVYYASVFNPARTNLALFERHVPPRFHESMPEVAGVRELTRTASARTLAMQNKKVSPSLSYVPAHADHFALARAARGCEACHLYKNATQTVFGEGPVTAPLVLVGEQPGDQEDLQGHPFVGPAGRVLDAALEETGIPRDQVYLTNAVKHFKWEPRGKRRLHQKPNAMEVHACHGWLEAELSLVKPEVIVCLGATAAQAFMGRTFKITQSRGELFDATPWGAKKLLATYHPSALLRMMSDEAAYAEAKAQFESDLARAASLVSFGTASRGSSGKARARATAAAKRGRPHA